MSIIQKIRDKYAAVAIATIAIAMVGFILIDALSSRTGGGVFSSNTTMVGKVDGEKINRSDFEILLKKAEDNYTAQGMQVNEQVRGQINNSLWKDMVDQKILEEQIGDLGLTFTSKEMESVLYGPNPPELLRRNYTDQKTGQYNAEAVRQMIQTLKHRPASDAQRQGLEDYLDNKVTKDALRNKYLIMLMGSAYYPKWLSQKDNQDNSAMANISYVFVPYALVPDSALPVSDGEIKEYISAHKAEFSSNEASRDLSYVVFDGNASSNDSTAILSQLAGLKAGFVAATDAPGFLNQNGSSLGFFDGFVAKSRLQIPNKDSVMALPVGGVFGPYLDGGNFVIAKMLEKKDLPDSVRARHILVATVDPRSGQQIMDDSTAKRKIDSIQNLIARGANFDSLAIKLSDDEGSKEKGGDLGYFASDRMLKEFADFCFNGKKGEKKVVKSQVGYHFIEILDQKDVEPHYKVAYLGKEIVPSEETSNAANAAATAFSGDAQAGSGSFDDVAHKHNNSVRSSTVKESDFEVPGIGPARRMVQWAYTNKVGAVGDPEAYGNLFIVTRLSEIHDAGLPSGSYARLLVENSVRRDKKAKQIMEKLGAVQDLAAAAAKFGQTVQHADSINFGTMAAGSLGNEPKVVGAAFNKANLNKVSAPIQGNAGVYVLKTDGVLSLPNQNNDYSLLRENREGMMRNTIGQNAAEGLHAAADIKDYRIKFY